MKNLTAREWTFVLIIISIVQGVIWYASFVNAGNGTALNYVSFAGTLISIILAVLAIGYTYGESVSEKNKSNALQNQIETLNSILKNITIQSASVEDLSQIRDDLQTFSNNLTEGITTTQRKVEDIKSSLNNFIDKSKIEQSSGLTKEVRQQIIQTLTNDSSISIMLPLIIILFMVRMKSSKLVTTLGPILKDVETEWKKQNSYVTPDWFYYGSTSSVQSILEQFDLLKEENNTLVLNQEFEVEIAKKMHGKTKEDVKSYHTFLAETLIDKISHLSQ